MRILYGPIDSWRFGRSLGVDPLAARHKLCPFSCVYCQYGETPNRGMRRRAFVPVERLCAELGLMGDLSADCVTFAGLGEPTLATNLPVLVAAIRERCTLPVFLLTGGGLMPRADVRRDLTHFDRVVITINAPDEVLFRQLNRPARTYPYSLAAIVKGLSEFRQTYTGELILHVMLVHANLHLVPRIAALVRRLEPDGVQLNTPLQPALGRPISAREMRVAAEAFVGMAVRSVYDCGEAGFRPRGV